MKVQVNVPGVQSERHGFKEMRRTRQGPEERGSNDEEGEAEGAKQRTLH